MTNEVKYYCISTKPANDYWNESQLVNKVPISKYSLNATIFYYVLAIRTENYKIREFKTSGLTGC